MRTLRAVLVVIVVASLCAPMSIANAEVGREQLARETESPPGQIVVVTANARQARVLDVARFRRLLGLVEAIRTRPPAFDGGFPGAVTAPDVILLQEISPANVEILRRLFIQRSRFNYEIVAAESNRRFLMNTDTLSLEGEPVSWDALCARQHEDRVDKFIKARFTEIESGLSFSASGVHYPRKNPQGESACKERNTAELRSQLAAEAEPVIIGGDFNTRPVSVPRECDPDEQTTAFDWYTMMTAPADGGRVYVDAVRRWNRSHGVSMEQSWTHEWEKTKTLCNGRVGLQRSRIDYLFAAGAQVIDARADHPGWAGDRPGSRAPDAIRYSDHRFVYGRFLIGDTGRATRPTLQALRRGDVGVTWDPVEGATGYLLYRALRGHSYSLLQRLDAATTSFRDFVTEHNTDYRYAVAAIGADGSQGAESSPARIRVDAGGPRVENASPRPGAVGVARGAKMRVRFDEGVAADSVDGRTMQLWREGRRIPGRTIRTSARVLTFNPRARLGKRKTYRAVVGSVQDRFGNRGPRFSWRFTTAGDRSG
jgi:exonuclease III